MYITKFSVNNNANKRWEVLMMDFNKNQTNNKNTKNNQNCQNGKNTKNSENKQEKA